MIWDTFRFLLGWFVLSVPVGLLLGRFFAYQSRLSEQEIERYLKRLQQGQFMAYADNFNFARFSLLTREFGTTLHSTPPKDLGHVYRVIDSRNGQRYNHG